MIVELNEEMTLADIKKKITEDEKKLLGNIAKVQKLENENAELVKELSVLNQQKTDKLLAEAQARMLGQFDLLASLQKSKNANSKNRENGNSKNANSKNRENGNSKNANSKNRENGNSENAKSENPKIGNSENAKSENPKIGNSENAKSENPKIGNLEKSEIGNSEKSENRNLEKSEIGNSEKSEIGNLADDPESGLKKIAIGLGLSEDANVAEITEAFETNKQYLSIIDQEEYAKILRSINKE